MKPISPPAPDAIALATTCVAQLDARGLACPLPLLQAKQVLLRLQPGECLHILATDAGSVRDFKSFANLSGNPLKYFDDSLDFFEFIMEKGQKA